MILFLCISVCVLLSFFLFIDSENDMFPAFTHTPSNQKRNSLPLRGSV